MCLADRRSYIFCSKFAGLAWVIFRGNMKLDRTSKITGDLRIPIKQKNHMDIPSWRRFKFNHFRSVFFYYDQIQPFLLQEVPSNG